MPHYIVDLATRAVTPPKSEDRESDWLSDASILSLDRIWDPAEEKEIDSIGVQEKERRNTADAPYYTIRLQDHISSLSTGALKRLGLDQAAGFDTPHLVQMESKRKSKWSTLKEHFVANKLSAFSFGAGVKRGARNKIASDGPQDPMWIAISGYESVLARGAPSHTHDGFRK